jgi:two-component system, OmpR family, response regulator MprA
MRLLIVEDEVRLASPIRKGLREEGLLADVAISGEDALWMATATAYDVIVLDVMLPGIDGFETCARLRADGVATPMLMLTARDAVDDRVAGLDAGADDYLVKPFALDELNARVRALLRRASGDPGGERLSYLDLELDLATLRARRGGRPLELTRTEQRLLELLLRNPEQVLPRDVIYERVWGHDISATSNSLDVYVGYLRRKTEEDGQRRLIHTVRGVGFMLAA